MIFKTFDVLRQDISQDINLVKFVKCSNIYFAKIGKEAHQNLSLKLKIQ